VCKKMEFDFQEKPCYDGIVMKLNAAMAADLLSGIQKILINRRMTDLEDAAVGLLIESLTTSLKEG
jgi:hypothetical protein